jgi:predicted DNA-binding transcriptional regulator AlpA
MENQTSTQNLISVSEYAAKCNITKVTAYKRIRSGEIPSVKIANLICLDASKVSTSGPKKRGRRTAAQIIEQNKQANIQ